MNQPPDDQYPFNEQERRQQINQERETLRLKQEQQRLKVAKRRRLLDWIRNTIILLIGALEILLALRFFLRISIANPANEFAQLIFTLSDPFVAPFSTLFISPTNADASRIFDLNVLAAMVAYGLLGALGIAVVNYFEGPVSNQR
jgi:uncharacterized protein YggT (Ycf19 family)